MVVSSVKTLHFNSRALRISTWIGLCLCSLLLFSSFINQGSALASPRQFEEFNPHGPYIDEVVFSVFHGPEAQWAALLDGLIDVGNEPITPQDVSDIEVSEWAVTGFWGIACSTHFDPFFLEEPIEGPPGSNGFPFNILELRQAIAMAIDKYELAQICFGDLGVALDHVIPASISAWHEPDLQIDYRSGDIEGARALLESAGFSDYNEDGHLDAPDTTPVTLRFYYTPHELYSKAQQHSPIATNTTRIAEYIGSILGQLGFRFELNPVDETTLYYYTHFGARAYHMALLPFVVPDRVQSFLKDLFYSYSIPTTNIMNYHDEAVDGQLEALNTTVEYSEYQQLISEIQIALAQNQPLIPLVTKTQYTANRVDRFDHWLNKPGTGAANSWSLLQARLQLGQEDRNPITGVGGTMEFGLNDVPDTLNPIIAQSDDSWLVLDAIYSRLIHQHPITGEPLAGLARSWIIEPEGDGLKITFNLMNNVSWHDGTRFTAYDVNFTYHYLNDLPGPWSLNRPKPYIPFTQIEVLNNITVVVHTPLNGFNALFDISQQVILPKHIWEGILQPATFENPRPVGTGPFKFISRPEAGLVFLEYYEDFHFGIPGARELPEFVDIYLLGWLSGGIFVVVLTTLGAIWFLRRTPHGFTS